jgi:hypothetical protein
MHLLVPEQVYSLHELLLSAYRILQLPLLVNQVLLKGTQPQPQPLLFLDRRREMFKLYKPKTYCKKRITNIFISHVATIQLYSF